MSYNNNRRRNNNGGYRKGKYNGSKTERMYKPVPKISTLNNKIKKIQNSIELKYKDTQFIDAVDSGGELVLLNAISVGTSQNGLRIGAEVDATSIQFRGRVITAPLNIDTPVYLRAILFWDRQPNGAAPTFTGDPLTSVTPVLNTAIVTEPVWAPYAYESQDRYRVLYDKVFTLNPNVIRTTTAGTTSQLIPYGIYFKKKIKLNRKVKYDDTIADIASIVSNSLYMGFVSSEAANEPEVYAGYRLYYKDA